MICFILDTGPAQQFTNNRTGVRDYAELECRRRNRRIFSLLKRTGRPMQQIDILIAANAMSPGNCVVFTTDSEMLAIPGLRTVNWSKSVNPRHESMHQRAGNPILHMIRMDANILNLELLDESAVFRFITRAE